MSAGYVLASRGADRIVLPRTGAVGSIGVVALHTDMSGRWIRCDRRHADPRRAHKVDANPTSLFRKPHDQMRTSWKWSAPLRRNCRQVFVDRLTHEAAGPQRLPFARTDAIAAGLADEVADPITAFHAFAAAPRAPPPAERVRR